MKQVPGVINTPGDPTRLFDSCQVTNNAKRIGATCYKYNERLNTHFFVCVKTPQFNGGLSLPIPWIIGYFISSSKNQIVHHTYPLSHFSHQKGQFHQTGFIRVYKLFQVPLLCLDKDQVWFKYFKSIYTYLSIDSFECNS